MVAMSGLEIPQRAVRNQLASAIDVVIQLERLSDGRRKLTSFQEVTGMEGEIVTMQEIFTLERKGIDADRRVLAEVVPTGIRPRFAERLQLAGIELPDTLFNRRMAA
jgi:pilus assembly protein CpaF